MVTRKPRKPELAQAVDSLNDAAHHVRNAVQGKIDEARGVAAIEIAKARAAALKKTGLAQQRIDALLIRAEARLHKLIAKAQQTLDRAVREAEKRSTPPPQPAVAPPPARASKRPARKATPAKKAAPAKGAD